MFAGRDAEVADALYYLNKEVMRRRILDEGIRADGRKITEIRPIWCETGVLARTARQRRVHPRPDPGHHRSHAGFPCARRRFWTAWPMRKASAICIIITMPRLLHRRSEAASKAPGRREIGHGALAERALEPVIPSEEEFPYALRLVSEILSSNGSSSMASVCGSTLALMDAGVPIKAPVAGVAMGLIKDVENSGKVVVLTDIQGLEDFLGDMDFKVAGTTKGITAIQMDIKIKGIDRAILSQALRQALEGRLHILGIMLECLPAPRTKMSPVRAQDHFLQYQS